jgi:chorismate mutase
MLDGREIPVPGSLPLCIRVLLHWNTDREQAEIRHIYLRGARALRPDLELSNLEPTEEEKK